METDPIHLEFRRKKRFLLVRTLGHLPCSTCQHPKLGMHRSMRRVVGLPPGVDFFDKKNDRCWCMESKYLKHPKKQENISKIRAWNIMCMYIYIYTYVTYVYISYDHDAWARQLSNIFFHPPLGFFTKQLVHQSFLCFNHPLWFFRVGLVPEVSQGQWERALMLLHQMPEWHLTPWP